MINQSGQANQWQFAQATNRLDPTSALFSPHLSALTKAVDNRRHNRPGHLFQGRFKANLMQKEARLPEFVRDTVLRPLRARLVRTHGDWRWSG